MRGIVPIVGPVMLGSIAEVEERSMTLEARGFTRRVVGPCCGPRRIASWQRLLRWLLVIGLVVLGVGRASGLVVDAGSS